MTPHDYSRIRPRLASPSGLQSAQYRMMELILGGREAKHVRLRRGNEDWAERLEAKTDRASQYDTAIRLLARRGFSISPDVLEHEVGAAWQYDAAVECIIGFRRGTGETSGVPHLEGVLKKAFYPELPSARTAI